MPQFMLLLSSPRALENTSPEATDPAFVQAIEDYNEALRSAGAFVDAGGLRPTADGFRTEYADGQVTVHDGPFTDRDEVLMGFWTIKADDLDAATEWASKVPLEADPASEGSQIEVRRLFDMDDFPEPEGGAESDWREAETEMRTDLEQAAPPVAEGTQRWFMAMGATAASEAGLPPEEKTLTEMGEFIGELYQTGQFVAGEGLKPTSEARRVRFEGGRKNVTDGPFTESKELVAGYSIVQTATREEAERIAVRGNLIGQQGGDIRLMW